MNQKDLELYVKYYMKIGKAEITATRWLKNPQVICSYQGLIELEKFKNENKKLRIALNVSLKTILELWEMPDVVHLDDHGEAINLIKETLEELESK